MARIKAEETEAISVRVPIKLKVKLYEKYNTRERRKALSVKVVKYYATLLQR